MKEARKRIAKVKAKNLAIRCGWYEHEIDEKKLRVFMADKPIRIEHSVFGHKNFGTGYGSVRHLCKQHLQERDIIREGEEQILIAGKWSSDHISLIS